MVVMRPARVIRPLKVKQVELTVTSQHSQCVDREEWIYKESDKDPSNCLPLMSVTVKRSGFDNLHLVERT